MILIPDMKATLIQMTEIVSKKLMPLESICRRTSQ